MGQMMKKETREDMSASRKQRGHSGVTIGVAASQTHRGDSVVMTAVTSDNGVVRQFLSCLEASGRGVPNLITGRHPPSLFNIKRSILSLIWEIYFY